MKLFIILAVVGLSSCAKLDRTYLPPYAQTSGGSANFLQTPNFSGAANNAYSQNGNGFAQNGNAFAQNEVAQNGNGVAQNAFAQNSNDFTQNRNGLAQSNAFDQDNNNFAQNQELNANSFASFESDRPDRPRAALERTAAILRQDSQNDGETYAYSFETENGISAEENGVATNGVEAQGGFSYTGDDGQVYSIRYTADQNGFVPQGEHLPTPPPIPEEILKALEQNARDEAAGIFDDGSYHEGKYADTEEGINGNMNYANQGGNNNNNGFNGNQNFGNNNFANGNSNFANGNSNFAGNDDSVVTNSAASTYLPPNEDQRAEIRSQKPETPVYRQLATNGVTAAYLPPRNQAQGPSSFNGQRAPQRSSSFGQRENIRRPSFNSRDGYQY